MKLLLPMLTALTGAIAGAKASNGIKGYTHLNFDISRGNSYADASFGNEARLVRREDIDGSVTMELENQSTFYSVTLKIGSNEDEVVVLVDTGSSDLWVSGSDNTYCSSSSSSSRKYRQITDKDTVNRILRQGKNSEKNLARYRQILDSRVEVDRIIHSGAGTGSNEDSIPAKRAPPSAKFRNIDDGDFRSGFLSPEVDIHEGFSDGLDDSLLAADVVNKAVISQTMSASSSQATIDCSKYGTFNNEESTTWHSNNTEFFILYGDSTFAYGTWGYDDISFDNITVENLSFAVANQSNSTMGVLGIGLEGLETTYTGSLVNNNGYTYANLPTKMVQDGLIHKRAYSLWLNEYSESTGSCLFGAIDKAKFDGTLSILPVLNTLKSSGYSDPIKLQITLSSISINSSSDSETLTSTARAALLDSGTTLTYLPSSVIENIATAVGAQYSSSYGYYIMSCPSSDDIYFVFTFQGVDIKIPVSDMVLEADTSGSTCVLAMSESDTVVLGDSFLRSVYLVYDLDNYQVAMAQAVYTTAEDIEVITSTIPQATTAASYSYTSGSDDTTAETDDITVTSLSFTDSEGIGSPNYEIPSYFRLALSIGSMLSIFLLIL